MNFGPIFKVFNSLTQVTYLTPTNRALLEDAWSACVAIYLYVELLHND